MGRSEFDRPPGAKDMGESGVFTKGGGYRAMRFIGTEKGTSLFAISQWNPQPNTPADSFSTGFGVSTLSGARTRGAGELRS